MHAADPGVLCLFRPFKVQVLQMSARAKTACAQTQRLQQARWQIKCSLSLKARGKNIRITALESQHPCQALDGLFWLPQMERWLGQSSEKASVTSSGLPLLPHSGQYDTDLNCWQVIDTWSTAPFTALEDQVLPVWDLLNVMDVGAPWCDACGTSLM
eukprot:scaffold36085_cov16-Tisochrysis_lutea.AAC.2